MVQPDCRKPIVGVLYAWLAVLMLLMVLEGVARAQSAPPEVSPPSDKERIDRLEKMLQTVVEENRRLSAEVRQLNDKMNSRPPEPSLPVVAPDTALAVPSDTGSTVPPPQAEAPIDANGPPTLLQPNLGTPSRSKFNVDYNNGFTIFPDNIDDTPFSLRIRAQDVFRYDGFSRATHYWYNSAGMRNVIANSNNFQIPRGRVIFSGTALMPKMSYLLNIDYNTVTNNPIGFRAYELSYRFSRAFAISVGQSKVPGSREWLESAFAPLQGPDRSMATTFFRPSLSQGIWITGQPLDGLYYHAMMSNGFNTLNLQPTQLNNRFCWSGSTWWEPSGEYGRGYSDLQNHERAAIRIGTSYTYALGRGSQADSDAVEHSPVRLSDGTVITTPGALVPGVTLQTYDISLAAFDFGYKYQGLGISTELYFQDLLGLHGTGPLPIHSTSAFGGFVQGGYFIIPQTTELYARSSLVTGHYGTGSEVASGVNWFILPGNENLRFTFDGAWLNHSPAGQNRTGYQAGQTGFLLRTQISVQY